MIETDVLVVGAGPAGTSCGIRLRQAGVDCLVIDRAEFPRDKICAGGMTPRAWRLLDSIAPGFSYEYQEVRRITLSFENQCCLDIEAAEPIRVVQRRNFDYALLQYYISRGGCFRREAFRSVEEQEDYLLVSTISGQKIKCRYLVGADGSSSLVRRHLTGKREQGLLCVEQYCPKSPDISIDITLSRRYDFGGYFFRFPNPAFDVLGFCDASTTPDKFRGVLKDRGLEAGRIKGQYLYLSNDYPLHPKIILIGDAGGFAHRVSYEGIYSAFVTGCNAATAIAGGLPFAEVNRGMFRRSRRDEKVAKLFYSKSFFVLLRTACRCCPRLVKAIFDAEIRHEALTFPASGR
ncbi:MAG: NAD(P)/FAD-dependent oxidoreductase [Bacteroidales bacterium]|nr:NAD(P)/FAD-dependent oxidoreductase [Bacteroidales bacterium]